MSETFRVLFVCTANKCRSPLAEYLLRAAVVERWGNASAAWQISSAGVNTGGGRPMDSTAMMVLGERGIDGSEFVNQRTTRQLVNGADLILTATREHRGQVAQLDPTVLSRIFTIKQFGYLLTAPQEPLAVSPSDQLELAQAGRDLIVRARAARSQLPGRMAEDDLNDPVGQPAPIFRRCAGELDAEIDQILGAI